MTSTGDAMFDWLTDRPRNLGKRSLERDDLEMSRKRPRYDDPTALEEEPIPEAVVQESLLMAAMRRDRKQQPSHGEGSSRTAAARSLRRSS